MSRKLNFRLYVYNDTEDILRQQFTIDGHNTHIKTTARSDWDWKLLCFLMMNFASEIVRKSEEPQLLASILAYMGKNGLISEEIGPDTFGEPSVPLPPRIVEDLSWLDDDENPSAPSDIPF